MATVLVALGCTRPTRVWVFTAPWDERSNASVAAGALPKATLVTGWIALDSLGGLPEALYVDTLGRGTAGSARRFALVTSYRGERFHPEAVRALAADPAARARAVSRLTELLAAGAYAGVVLDLEALAPEDTAALLLVTRDLAEAARRAGAREVAIAVPAEDTLAYPPRHLVTSVDRLLVMLYDQHWSGSSPGPVAANDWVQRQLEMWVQAVGADRVIAALPVYGYFWRPDTPTEIVGWGEFQALADARGVPPQRDTASGALRLRMETGHEAWLPDAVQLGDLSRIVRTAGVRTIAIWRLGLEDPRAWTILGVK